MIEFRPVTVAERDDIILRNSRRSFALGVAFRVTSQFTYTMTLQRVIVVGLLVQERLSSRWMVDNE